MDNTQIKSTVEYFREDGIDVRVRDIAFTLLSKMFSDSKTAYQCLFGADGYDEYISSDLRSQLEEYMQSEGYIRSMSTDEETGGITFEQNKRGMEQMLSEVERDYKAGLIEPKDYYARVADIRTKLNDKFKIERQNLDRQIIVERKFDFICPKTRKECYQLDKEFAMQKWNLIEKPE